MSTKYEGYKNYPMFSILKKGVIIFLKILICFLGFVLLYFLAAFILSRISVKNELVHEPQNIPIYILSNGAHTDMVVPIKNEQKDWSKDILFCHTLSKDTHYTCIGIGWGDKGFYLDTPAWSDLKLSVAFKAVFALSRTAIHATFYKEMIENERCKKIMISKEQYIRLVNYISCSFQTNSSGNIIFIPTEAVYGNSDAFYEAKGRYNLFFTCNSWTNKALKVCGQKACLWTAFDKGIFIQYP